VKSTKEINKINKRRKSGGFYLNQAESIRYSETRISSGTQKSGAKSF